MTDDQVKREYEAATAALRHAMRGGRYMLESMSEELDRYQAARLRHLEVIGPVLRLPDGGVA